MYQLGLLLHELLTGERPRAGHTPHRPSRFARERGESRLARRLRGEVDLIVGTALRPDPAERYASADELAADIRRHLRGLPIQAHPESATYRVRKFVARHPLVLPGMVAVAALAIGFATMLGVQNRRLQRERDAAEAASRLAQETQGLFVELLGSPDPYAPADPERGSAITVVEALRLGARRLDGELAMESRLHAQLLSTIGGEFDSLGQYDDARATLERANSLRMSGADSTSLELSNDYGLLASAVGGAGDLDSARALAEHRLQLERERDPPVPASLSDALSGAALAVEHAEPLTALALQQEAVRMLRPTGGVAVAGALRMLADRYRVAGNTNASERAAREALALFDSLAGPDSRVRRWRATHWGRRCGTW